MNEFRPAAVEEAMNSFMDTFDAAHVFRMSDDTGMFQHAVFSVPNLLEGYTTDDNARALIMAVMLYEHQQNRSISHWSTDIWVLFCMPRMKPADSGIS